MHFNSHTIYLVGQKSVTAMTQMLDNNELAALRLELETVKSELAASQAAARSETTIEDHSESTSAFRFLDLPPELRNAIYEFCLIVDKVQIRSPGCVTTYDMRLTPSPKQAQTQLFRTCKQVNSEARQTYISKNIFVIVPGPCAEPPYSPLFRSAHDKKLLRRLSVSLDYRDHKHFAVESYVGHNINYYFRRMGIAEELIHSRTHTISSEFMAGGTWFSLFSFVTTLKLDYLQINLQNCFCPSGCDRMVREAFESRGLECEGARPDDPTVSEMLQHSSPRTIDIIGTLEIEERDFIRQTLNLESGDLRFHGGWANLSSSTGFWEDEDKEVVDRGDVVEESNTREHVGEYDTGEDDMQEDDVD